MARPSKYTEELIEEIWVRLTEVEPMATTRRDEHMPEPMTVSRWANDRPEVLLAIAHAREAGEEVIAADCLNIADDNGKDIRYLEDGTEVTNGDVVQRAKLRIDTRLKLLAKWNPKKWGDKVDMTTGGEKIPQVIINVPPLPDGGPDT